MKHCTWLLSTLAGLVLAPVSQGQLTSTESLIYTASDGQIRDGLGANVKLAGAWAFLSAPASNALAPGEGAVYAYDLTTDREYQILATATGYSEFGAGLDSDGVEVAIGSPDAPNGGLIWVYEYDPVADSWTLRTTFSSQGAQSPGDRLGHSVCMDASYYGAGAPNHDGAAADTGFVHVRNRSTNAFQNLEPAGLLGGDLFGFDLQIAGDVMIVGAPEHNGEGAAYVYRLKGANWGFQTKLEHPVPFGGNRFGQAVTTNGTQILVAAPGTTLGKGEVFVFEEITPGAWTMVQVLTAHDAQLGNEFGSDVEMHGPVVVVGASKRHTNGVNRSGALYQFRDVGPRFIVQQLMQSSAPLDAGHLGYAVSTDGVRALGGEPGIAQDLFLRGKGLRFEVPPISLAVNPNPANLGDQVDLSIAGGVPSSKVGVFVFRVRSIRLFVPLFFPTLDSMGSASVSAKYNDPSFQGLEVELGAIGNNGSGGAVLSNLVTLELN